MRVKIVQNLSRWFQKNARSLPWRKHPDPYWVWLSEIMLQQTQIATVLPYFDRFLQAFPTIEDLARAPLDEVLKLWAGLGYYSRARNLHRGAKAIADRIAQGRGFPENRAAWLEVPGVGEYTAGAICSISLNQPEAIVDGNVVRVISRLLAIEKLDAKKTAIWSEARELVQAKGADPRTLNQAMMELGALICKPRNPKCELCPVNLQCQGKSEPERYPEPKAKTVWKHLKEEKWFLLRMPSKEVTEIYLEQNGNQGWRQGLWDFPNPGNTFKQAKWISEFETRYTVTTHKMVRKHIVLDLSGLKQPALPLKGTWFSTDDLPGVPSPVKKAILGYFNSK
ncbi:MAG: A/G-specific adenine glycosylase [Bdellovibrionales bacterium]|nr:A/G-specific adenine glycosylase [Oligoflexia bacterium]